jgi:hypothetical protein
MNERSEFEMDVQMPEWWFGRGMWKPGFKQEGGSVICSN